MRNVAATVPRQHLGVEDHITSGFASQILLKGGAYKGSRKEAGRKKMRNEPMVSKLWGVEPSNQASRSPTRRSSRPEYSTPHLVSSPMSVKAIYWHNELPPFDAEAIGEHVVEAASGHVPGTIAHRDELWDRCYEDLMTQARTRLGQETVRLGGNYAHVLNETVESHHNGATGESWLHGRFTYMLYRQPPIG